MRKWANHYSWIEILIITVCIVAAAFFYAGFYFPDPFASRTMGRRSFVVILWGTRFGVPVVILMLLFLYHGIKTGRISGINAAVTGISVIVALLIAYPVAAYLYYRSSGFQGKSSDFHPYLQLAPADFLPRHKADEKPITIICLGGSTTEFKDRTGQGWPDRLENLLRERYSGKAIYVYNMGRQWYTTLHTLINYEVNLRQQKPDIIIVMHAINDLLHNADFSYLSANRFRQDYGHFLGPISRIITRPTFEASLLSKVRSFWYHTPRQLLGQKEFPGLVSFERNMNSLIDLATLDSTSVVLITQPNLFKENMAEEEIAALEMVNYEAIGPRSQWTVESAHQGMAQYNAMTRKIAGDRRLVLIDLEKEVPKTLEYFHDDVHYRDIAFGVVAHAVASGLGQSGIMDR